MKKNQKPYFVSPELDRAEAEQKRLQKEWRKSYLEKMLIGVCVAITVGSIVSAVKDALDHEKEDRETED
ncbi:membrane protein [Arthrobacter phage Paella]|nr:membrane protein [Arthrobacter phage Paella]